MLLQRPASAYFSLYSRVRWLGPCSNDSGSGAGGLVVRELTSGAGVALGLYCSSAGLQLGVWQDTLTRVYNQSLALAPGAAVHLRLDVDLTRSQAWWSADGVTWAWLRAGDIFANTECVLAAGPAPDSPPAATRPSRRRADAAPPRARVGRYAFGYSSTKISTTLGFTTFHPGLWAGDGADADNAVHFDYWRYVDNEVDAPSCAVPAEPAQPD